MEADTLPPASEVTIVTSSEPDVPAQVDYFGFTATRRFMLSDRISYVDLKVLNEGERRRYLNDTNREVRFARGSGDASMKMRPGDEKASLLKSAIAGWNLMTEGRPVPFNSQTLDKFLMLTDPKVIDLVETEVRKMNPWLQNEMSLEDIDREIEQLQEMRKTKVDEEAGKATS